jgi:hypothetical protein
MKIARCTWDGIRMVIPFFSNKYKHATSHFIPAIVFAIILITNLLKVRPILAPELIVLMIGIVTYCAAYKGYQNFCPKYYQTLSESEREKIINNEIKRRSRIIQEDIEREKNQILNSISSVITSTLSISEEVKRSMKMEFINRIGPYYARKEGTALLEINRKNLIKEYNESYRFIRLFICLTIGVYFVSVLAEIYILCDIVIKHFH